MPRISIFLRNQFLGEFTSDVSLREPHSKVIVCTECGEPFVRFFGGGKWTIAAGLCDHHSTQSVWTIAGDFLVNLEASYLFSNTPLDALPDAVVQYLFTKHLDAIEILTKEQENEPVFNP